MKYKLTPKRGGSLHQRGGSSAVTSFGVNRHLFLQCTFPQAHARKQRYPLLTIGESQWVVFSWVSFAVYIFMTILLFPILTR